MSKRPSRPPDILRKSHRHVAGKERAKARDALRREVVEAEEEETSALHCRACGTALRLPEVPDANSGSAVYAQCPNPACRAAWRLAETRAGSKRFRIVGRYSRSARAAHKDEPGA
jgi:hypothetical protein